MYLVYSYKAVEKTELPEGFTVKQTKVGLFSSVHSFLWSLTRGRGFYLKYTLANNEGQEISFAEVLNNCLFLRFLPKGAVHIGPCFTPPKHRGNGYYPLLIKYIASLYYGKECYMFVHESNFPSIKGIEKAGFKRIGVCNKILNIYY